MFVPPCPQIPVEALTPNGFNQTPSPFGRDPCPSLSMHHSILVMCSLTQASRSGALKIITMVKKYMYRNKDRNGYINTVTVVLFRVA